MIVLIVLMIVITHQHNQHLISPQGAHFQINIIYQIFWYYILRFKCSVQASTNYRLNNIARQSVFPPKPLVHTSERKQDSIRTFQRSADAIGSLITVWQNQQCIFCSRNKNQSLSPKYLNLLWPLQQQNCYQLYHRLLSEPKQFYTNTSVLYV